MSDLAHTVAARLIPVDGSDLFSDLCDLVRAGRLAPVMGDAAPRCTVLEDGSPVFTGPELFVIFAAHASSGGLEFTICRSRTATGTPEAFSIAARMLGQRLLRFLMAVLESDAILPDSSAQLTGLAERLSHEAEKLESPRPNRVLRRSIQAAPPRPLRRPAPHPITPSRLTGHGKVPGLPSQETLRSAVLTPSSRPRRRRASLATALAVPVFLALVAVSGVSDHPVVKLWGKRGFELSDLTDYRQTSAALADAMTD